MLAASWDTQLIQLKKPFRWEGPRPSHQMNSNDPSVAVQQRQNIGQVHQVRLAKASKLDAELEVMKHEAGLIYLCGLASGLRAEPSVRGCEEV